jgi:hypothetical protein
MQAPVRWARPSRRKIGRRSEGAKGAPTADGATVAGAAAAGEENRAAVAEDASREVATVLPVSIEWRMEDALSTPWAKHFPQAPPRLFIALNPPYGKRIAVGSTEELFRRIGERCEELVRDPRISASTGPEGVRGCILCPSESSWEAFSAATPGLSKTTSHFSQGGIDVRLCVFVRAEEPRRTVAVVRRRR